MHKLCWCGAIPCDIHSEDATLQETIKFQQDIINHLRDMNSRANDGIEELHKKITRITNVANHHEWVANKYKAQYEKVVAELEKFKKERTALMNELHKTRLTNAPWDGQIHYDHQE